MKNCGVRTIGVMTTCGEVIVHRRRYRCRCRGCQHEVHPADARLCCGRHRVSRPLAKRVCPLAAVEHFTRLPKLVMAQHGVTLCHETILEPAHDVGGAAERRRLAEARSSAARREPPPVTLPNPPQRVCVSVDGIMSCTNPTEPDADHPGQQRLKWQQLKVGCVDWQDDHERWHKQRVWGRESPEEFAASLWRLARPCGYGQAEEKLFAADGGGWCRDIHARDFSDATGILDGYHASEHVWAAAKVVDPESSTVWANDALTQRHEGGGTGLAAWLKTRLASRSPAPSSRRTPRLRERQGPPHELPRRQSERLANRLGHVESTCKQLVAQRLKGPGRHWSEPGALAITALRATDLNGHWNPFWNTLTMKT